MAVGFPAKTSFTDGTTLPASDLNDVTGTLNLINPSAKGDIFVGSAANTYTRLPVGTDGFALKASSTATTGVVWATAGTVAFQEQQFTASGTWTAPTGVTKAWVLVVGGGGGGATCGIVGTITGATAASSGGQGGAQFVTQATVSPATAYTVTVGGGGAKSTAGTSSVFDIYTGSGGNTGFVFVQNGAAGGGGGGSSYGAGGAPFGNGGANTGGGGGGCTNSNGSGTSGGSGIVIVRWLA
jgi:hypothetical protein